MVSPKDLIQETPRIYQNLPVGLCYLDTDFRFIHINDWLAEINGIPAEEHLGRTIGELIPDVAAGVEAKFRQVIDTGEPIIGGTVEAETSAQPGIKRLFQHSYHPVWSDDGKVIGISCVVEDITARKRAEETLLASEHILQERVADLEEAQRKLEKQGESLTHLADDLRFARDEARGANRAKSQFLATMSHELRTPLNAIIGFSDVIKQEMLGPVGSTKYREYAYDINESGQHLLDLINNILDLSKVESGVDEIYEEDIKVPDVLRAVMVLIKERAHKADIRIEFECPSDLPALRVDSRKLKQILVNLLTNAIKFTPAGGTVTLKTWSCAESGHVFQIADTGIGIAPEDIPKALSQFGQVEGDLNRQYEGTGLGLPLTKALVEQHGGTMDLKSQVGVGTTVTVLFPAERIVSSPSGVKALDAADRKVG